VVSEAALSFSFLARTKNTKKVRKIKRTVSDETILIISITFIKASNYDRISSPVFVTNMYSINTFSMPEVNKIVRIDTQSSLRMNRFLINTLKF
jgi:hypothetical protein